MTVNFNWQADGGRFGTGSLVYESLDDTGYAYLTEMLSDDGDWQEITSDSDRTEIGCTIMDILRKADEKGFYILN